MPERVLIVDDEPNLRKVLGAHLQREGYDTVLAGDGEAALEIIEKGGIDVVVTDMVMPKLDGIALLRHVVETYPDLPTIGELGYPDATVSVWYGMSGPKGLPDDVRKTLEKALAGVLTDPEVKKFMTERGLSPAPLYGDEFRDAVYKELARWKDIVRTNNIKAD